MDEFVNWDQADPAPGTAVEALSQSMELPGQSLDDLDLALENVEGDDFSFWALQHFENHISPTMATTEEIPMPTDRSTRTFEDHLETPLKPCENCQANLYQCKQIPEGQYKGYCTSCVALGRVCSFGLASMFPPNPWPVMGDHPDLLHEDTHEAQPTTSASELSGLAAAPDITSANSGSRGKAGARFSRESVKILKNWLSTHSKHPYPNDEEKEMLQKQTGLNKTQITNWLANTRRRNKNTVGQRSTSPGVRSWTNPIDIPQRRGTPASLEHMNPLQRWQVSPPENEPASVRDIARAINSTTSISSGLNSPYSAHFTDDGSGRSLCDSNISSANTSHSGTSVYSHGSRGSFGSGGSVPRGRRRRRRRVLATGNPQTGQPKTFQCTFCTETFRTKHDWQRHEKSLHLSLERWVCSPNGAQAFNPENGQMSCVFCGEPNPDETHIDSHNHSACQERSVVERTFYRKDHLRQHLKLVHNVKFASWSMEQWKATTPEIRSRCGFCGTVMDTWSIRVDHLAEHFKKGKSMRDWKGDWGFDAPVLDMVENSIPPYLIHDERNSPDPFEASQPLAASARNAFELIKSELTFYIDEKRDAVGKIPSDEELQRTACSLIYDAEELATATEGSTASWLRDLLFCSKNIAQEARWTRAKAIKQWHQLKINGRRNIFELDPMEAELQEYVKARQLLGLTAMDRELQAKAVLIIRRAEGLSEYASEDVARFLIRLVNGSTSWLAGFRQRAQLPRAEDLADEARRSKDTSTIDSTVHNPSRLESELGEYVREQRARGYEPTDADLQTKARLIIYEFDDGWNQTAADDPLWLATFKQGLVAAETNVAALLGSAQLPTTGVDMASWDSLEQSNTYANRSLSGGTTSPFTSGRSGSGASGVCPLRSVGTSYLNDANCYQRLARELKKWVAATMSPNNPNCHVPTDEELQHQARWIVYEDDDRWNQTAADNAEWLRRFKRDVGLLTDPTLPGLPSTLAWNISQGGSGFSPPYLCPNPRSAVHASPFHTADDIVAVTMREGAKPVAAHGSTANRFCQALATPRDPPPNVFCSRELERELSEFVAAQVVVLGRGGFPSDGAIRERARAFLTGTAAAAAAAADGDGGDGDDGRTPADDPVLLGKFKQMMMARLGLGEGAGSPVALTQGGAVAGNLMLGTAAPAQMTGPTDLTGLGLVGGNSGTLEGAELDGILQEMDFDFGDLGDFVGVATGGMPMDTF